jgi:hypothetical protein
MKISKILVTGVVLSISCLVVNQVAQAKKGGTSILHLTVESAMSGSGVDADASGSVSADTKIQGGAEKQSLEIEVEDLDTNATYSLQAKIGDDTNLVEVATFQTDAAGSAAIRYAKQGQGKAKGKPGVLPAVLDPVSDIRELAVVNVSTQVVMSADLTDPSKLQYLVKRAMDNDGLDNDAAASLRIKSNGVSDQFRLRASGLDPSAVYYLSINGSLTETMSDANGALDLSELPDGSPSVLDIHDLAVLNSISNSVLSIALP